MVEDGQALLEAAQRLKPDVVVADITMLTLGGKLKQKEHLSARMGDGSPTR